MSILPDVLTSSIRGTRAVRNNSEATNRVKGCNKVAAFFLIFASGMKVGIIIAMSKEYEIISGLIGGQSSGRLGGNDLVLARSGIGKVNAAIKAVEMISLHKPDCLISTGCAGGADTSIAVMDVVASSQVAYHDVWCGEGNEYGQVQGLPPRFDADAHLLDLAKQAGAVPGLIASGDRFCTRDEEIAQIKERFPDALAVDMESCSVAQVCHLDDVPFLSLRVISDCVGSHDRILQYKDFWGSVTEKSVETVERFLEIL